MAFCKICDREVGVEKKRSDWAITIFVILGMVTPFWPITLPLFWSIAFIIYISAPRVCGICKSKLGMSKVGKIASVVTLIIIGLSILRSLLGF